MPTSFQLLHGVDTPPSSPLVLRAGPLTAQFEPELAFLRYLSFGGREVVRGIYGAVRDDVWGTVSPQVTDLQVEQEPGSFRVRFKVNCREGKIDFHWWGEITGEPDRVRFVLSGAAGRTFLTNRTGLCVLHPVPRGATNPCSIELVDGTERSTQFPLLIEPHQPFQELRSLRQELAPGVTARLLFEGDTFETEDQRNWTDASFKTYSRPLALPKPYPLQAGESVEQAITVTFAGDLPSGEVDDAAVAIRITADTVGRLPQLGLGVASHEGSLSSREIERLRALRLAHLRVDLHLCLPGYRQRLQRAAADAAALGARLEVALFVTAEAPAELAELTTTVGDLRVPIARWLIFHERERATPESCVTLARRLLREAPVYAPLGGGTNNSFADLNRHREALTQADLGVFAINPQVHAFDDRTLIENLEGQAHAANSARWIAPGKPVVVSPVTLRPRFNAEATGPEPPPAAGELPFAVDPRQMSLFGAGWTLGSVHALARAGVSSATYYETTGWRGVMETEEGSPLPELFASFPGGVFPLYHVLADLAGSRAEVLGSLSSRPLGAEALALRSADGQVRVLITNHTGTVQSVTLSGLPGPAAWIRVLDLSNVERAMREPEAYRTSPGPRLEITEGELALELGPYAVATLELESGDE